MPPVMILAVGWALVLVYGYPGQVTTESLEVLRAVRKNHPADVDPPMLYVLWKALEVVIAGPLGLFVVQVVTFSVGAWVILGRALSPRGAAWAATGLLVFPPILVPMAMIGTHSLMAGFLLLGAAGLLSERRGRRVAGVAALFAATAVHEAALVATLPLVIVVGQGLGPGSGPGSADRRGWTRPVIAVATWLAITAAALGANGALGARRSLDAFGDGDRSAMTERLLGVGDSRPDPMAALADRPTDTMLKRGVPPRTSELQDALVDGVRACARTPIFWPWIYLVVAVVLVPLARRQRDVLALLASGVLYELSLFATATSAEYPQSHWMIACTGVAAVVVVARRTRVA